MDGVGSADIFEFGRFRFERPGRCLLRVDQAGKAALVPLGHTALDVLEMLVAAQGGLVKPEEIIQTVWSGRTVEDANVAAQISNLRKRLGRRCIQTVPGCGYRFVAAVKQPSGDYSSTIPEVSQAGDRQIAAPQQITHFDERPAIAVLPFTNVSGDPDQEHFVDGITDEIITELASWRSFPVIARGSTFVFKHQDVDIQSVSRQLDARYVVEGSVARIAAQVRITAKLIDGTTGHHLSVERYKRNIDELFEIQDEIVQTIVGSIAPDVLKIECERVERRPPPNPTSYEYFMRGLAFHYRYTKEDNAEAQRLFREAIKADPKNAQAYALLAHAILHAVQHRWREDDEHNYGVADKLAAQAVALDRRAPFAHFALGSTSMFLGRTEQALTEMQEAVRVNPSHAAAHAIMAHLLCYMGRPAEGLLSIERASRLSPHDPRLGLWIPAMAQAYYFLERYEDAIAAAWRALELIPGNVIATRFLAASLGQLGRAAEAAPAVAFLQDSREPTLADQKERMEPIYRAAGRISHVLAGLQKAGLT